MRPPNLIYVTCVTIGLAVLMSQVPACSESATPRINQESLYVSAGESPIALVNVLLHLHRILEKYLSFRISCGRRGVVGTNCWFRELQQRFMLL